MHIAVRRASVLVAVVAMRLCWDAEGVGTVSLAPHEFTIPGGKELKRVDTPPLVPWPINMCFEEHGVRYVTDSSGNTEVAPVERNDPQRRMRSL